MSKGNKIFIPHRIEDAAEIMAGAYFTSNQMTMNHKGRQKNNIKQTQS